jgi:acetylornithine deacetylase/succinyl-diaminopimelate desuccinylase-like protein
MKLRAVLAILLLAGCASSTPAQISLPEHIRAIPWERYQEEAVGLLEEYLQIDTSNPPGNELAAAEFFHHLFDRAGIHHTVYLSAPGRGNVYAVLKGDGSLRPLILLNHTDVVRAESASWRVPPFSGQTVEGELYGRGALDMKDEGLLQAMVMLIAARERLPLKRDLVFLATADEEVGGTGSTWILRNHPELVRGAEYLITEGGGAVIYPERGTIYDIGVGEKAPFWIRLTATGHGGHGSVPIADSATHRLARAMQRVVDWQTPIRLLPSVEQYFHEIAQLEKEPRASQFRDIRNALGNPAFVKALSEDEDYNYLLRDTISLTVLKGSEQTNVIPDTAYCELDVRLLPGQDPKAFLEQLRGVVADDQIRVEPLGSFRAPNASSTDTVLYRIIEEVVHQYNPQAFVVPALNSGYTESQMYRRLGISCYGFAPLEITPELEGTEHAANERVPVEQIRRGVKMLYEVVARAANQ